LIFLSTVGIIDTGGKYSPGVVETSGKSPRASWTPVASKFTTDVTAISAKN
jgi:hypothetical protein